MRVGGWGEEQPEGRRDRSVGTRACSHLPKRPAFPKRDAVGKGKYFRESRGWKMMVDKKPPGDGTGVVGDL